MGRHCARRRNHLIPPPDDLGKARADRGRREHGCGDRGVPIEGWSPSAKPLYASGSAPPAAEAMVAALEGMPFTEDEGTCAPYR